MKYLMLPNLSRFAPLFRSPIQDNEIKLHFHVSVKSSTLSISPYFKCGVRDLNPRPSAWEADVIPS